jgi:hypothetical protein
LAEGDEVAVGSEDQEFALAVGLVGGTMDVGFGESVELGFEFGVERVDVADIDVIGEAAIAGRRAFRAVHFEDANAGGFAMEVGVVVGVDERLEAEDVGEEFHGALKVVDDHKGRDLDEVGRHGTADALSGGGFFGVEAFEVGVAVKHVEVGVVAGPTGVSEA